MRKILQTTALIISALLLLSACAEEPGYVPVSSVTREVVPAPEPVTLTPIEFSILRLLISHPGRV